MNGTTSSLVKNIIIDIISYTWIKTITLLVYNLLKPFFYFQEIKYVFDFCVLILLNILKNYYHKYYFC